MTVEVVPNALFSLKNVTPILGRGSSCILHKTLSQDLVHKAIYVTTPLIVFIRQGKQVIRDYDGADNVIDENHLIFVSKGVYTVSDYVTRGGGFEAVLFFYDDKLISRYLAGCASQDNDEPVRQRAVGTCILRANDQIRRFVDSIEQVYRADEGSDALLELKLTELLHLIAIQDKSDRFVQELACGDGRNVKRRQITDFMEQYYSHKLKIEDYALLTGRSVSTFIRDFKKSYSTTPNRWLIEKKVDTAHQLMLNDNYSVTDAAIEVGYEDPSHFIKAYKRKYGMTPKKAKSSSAAL